MTSLLIQAKDSDVKLVKAMLKKMGIATKVLTSTEKEDAALGYLVQKADRSKKVGREAILKFLCQ